MDYSESINRFSVLLEEIAKENESLTRRGTIMKFSDIPIPEIQLSIYQYLVEREIWDNLGEANEQVLEKVSKKYGDKEFGIVTLPMKELTDHIMKTNIEIGDDFDSFEDYHQWYMRGDGVDKRDNHKWAVALSGTKGESLDDGWHRLHSYYSQNVPKVNAYWFL